MMKRGGAALVALGVAAVLATAAFAQNGAAPGDRTRPNAADQRFMEEATQGGMAEVQLGQLAERQGASDAVKQFGHRMYEDHSKANDELKALADREGVALPSHMSLKDQKLYDRLVKLSPQRLDRVYSRDMVRDHQQDIRASKKEAQTGQDPEVKAWAAKTLPTLTEHLRMAQDRGKTTTSRR